MITSVTQFDEYPRDKDNAPLPLGQLGAPNTTLTATGNVVMGASSTFIRVATDVAVYIDIGATATTADAYIPAGTTEYFAVRPGDTVYITSA